MQIFERFCLLPVGSSDILHFGMATQINNRSGLGMFDDGRIHGLETVTINCPACNAYHQFEDQGLRWVGLDCLTVHFPTLDQVADQAASLRKAG